MHRKIAERVSDQLSVPRPTIVLVTGSGRSGTSSLAGSLKRLGLHVPQPEVPAKPSNERGFYEPQWVIDFHKQHLKTLGLHNIDSRPHAAALVAALLADGSIEAELRNWLEGQLEHGRIVIKDPHAFWFAAAWRTVAHDLDVDLKFLTAVRHPAEVVGSRDLAYLQKRPAELRQVKETSNIAGWVNAALLTEEASRGLPRAFIRYTDLIADWRGALSVANRQLALGLEDGLTPGRHHPIDDFIDSDLRNSQVTWDHLRVPDDLRDLAEELWQLLGLMVDEPDESAHGLRLDELRVTYDDRYQYAAATVYDHTTGEVLQVRRDADAQIATLRDKLRRHRQLVQELRQQQARPANPARRLVRRLRSR